MPSYIYRSPSPVSAQVATASSSKTADETKRKVGSKDSDQVFVAGATGRVGSRTVRELLKLGFRVRAGVRSAQRAEALVKSVREMKLGSVTGSLETQPVEKLEIVECDLENKSTIAQAIGISSVVICCIGASEKEVFDVTGPYRIDYMATKNLIEAATVAEVEHFILVTSLGTNKFGLPAAVLNLFWGVLCWKRRAEEALLSSGLPYTIVRPGGMERPTDSYKETHNIVLANEDTYFGGQVSTLQVAELMAFMAKNRGLAFCKVVEVIAETTSPLTPMEELLAKIPPQRELPTEPKPDPLLNIESEPTVVSVEKELGDARVPKANPQSPFAMYEDLKPPTSPAPTPSTVSKFLDNGPASDFPLLGVGTVNNIGETSPLNVREENLLQKLSNQSPYSAYDDLKPPTSPTPSTPSVFISTSVDVDNSTTEESSAQHHTKQSRPLSPYTMYEDLKPPSSPVPSVPSY